MDFLFIILVIVAPILSILGWLFWLVLGGWVAKKSFYPVVSQDVVSWSRGGRLGGSDLDVLLSQLDQAFRSGSAGHENLGSNFGAFNNLSADQPFQIQGMMLKAQSHMAQMDAIGRQRYDNRISELSSMAASAGIDWTPGSY